MILTAQETAHLVEEPELQSANVGSFEKEPNVQANGLGVLGIGWKY